MPGIGTDKSQALWGEKLYPKTGGKAIYSFYPGSQNQLPLKWMNPGDNQCGGSAAWWARQRFMSLLQSLLVLKRRGAGGLCLREGRQQVTRCCERELPARLAPRHYPPGPAGTFPFQTLGTCFRFQGTWALMSPPERTAARGVCVNLLCEAGIFSVF